MVRPAPPPPPPPPPRPNVDTSAAINAGKQAVDAAKNAMPRPGDVQPGGTGKGGGAAVEANAGGGRGGGVAQAGIAGKIAAAGGAAINAQNNPYSYKPPTNIEDVVIDIGVVTTPNSSSKSGSGGKSGSGAGSGSTTKVTSTGPTTGTTPTATPSPLPGPTSGTTPTSRPADPPDAKQSQTAAAKKTYDDLSQKAVDEEHTVKEISSKLSRDRNSLTQEEKDFITNIGGEAKLDDHLKQTWDERDAAHKKWQQSNSHVH